MITQSLYQTQQIREKNADNTYPLQHVISTVSDRAIPQEISSSGNVSFYQADIKSYSDYYPFGMQMPGRFETAAGHNYRYGMSGMERDDEMKGAGNSYDFGRRIYDPRIGRWLTVDPLRSLQPDQSTYKAFLNNPLVWTDPDGGTEYMTIVLDNRQTGEKISIRMEVSNDVFTSHVYENTMVYYYDYNVTHTYVLHKDGNVSYSQTWDTEGKAQFSFILGGVFGLGKQIAKYERSKYDQASGYHLTTKYGGADPTKYVSRYSPQGKNIEALLTALLGVGKSLNAPSGTPLPEVIQQVVSRVTTIIELADQAEKEQLPATTTEKAPPATTGAGLSGDTGAGAGASSSDSGTPIGGESPYIHPVYRGHFDGSKTGYLVHRDSVTKEVNVLGDTVTSPNYPTPENSIKMEDKNP